jgi:hypothetical protein
MTSIIVSISIEPAGKWYTGRLIKKSAPEEPEPIG